MMRCTALRSKASTAHATAKYVLPVPAGPMPKVMSWAGILAKYVSWLGVRARKSLRRVCNATPPSASIDASPASISCTISVGIVRAARSYKACKTSIARVALALCPSILNCSCLWAILTSSANSIVRKCSSVGPQRCDKRVLLGGEKVWRRIKSIISKKVPQ